jgi:hypothetical protein
VARHLDPSVARSRGDIDQAHRIAVLVRLGTGDARDGDRNIGEAARERAFRRSEPTSLGVR